MELEGLEFGVVETRLYIFERRRFVALLGCWGFVPQTLHLNLAALARAHNPKLPKPTRVWAEVIMLEVFRVFGVCSRLHAPI